MEKTDALRSQVKSGKARPERRKQGKGRGPVAAKSWKGAVGSQLRAGKARSGRNCKGKNGGLRRPKTTAERTKWGIK